MFLSTSVVLSKKKLPGLSSKSKNKSPVAATHGVALTNCVSALMLLFQTISLIGTYPLYSAGGVFTVSASMLGPPLAGATNLLAS